ncbi:MAG: hypothetical protein EAZ27_03965 [Cytophagales bacterium]|nr:MAG: hypothetical protein EAZ27_03965 [Cytophagales bacterium]
MKVDYYKEKIKTDTELLKLFFSALLLLLGILGTLLMKDNFGGIEIHLFILIIITMLIFILGSFCFSFKDSIDKNLNNLLNDDYNDNT